MNPEIKAQWTTRLRSGEDEQGTGALNKDGKLCCLGVLCELAVKAGIVRAVLDSGDGCTRYGSEDEQSGIHAGAEKLTLPESVQDWAGLDSENPEVGPYGGDGEMAAAYLNDNDVTFAQLADLIDYSL